MTNRSASYQSMRAPRGPKLSCKGWPQEAALRMLLNTLDPEVAERPKELIACEGAAKPARDWESFHAIAAALRALEADETLLVQSGRAAAVLGTKPGAPRVVIGLETMTAAGSWTCTGTQAQAATSYETFQEAANRHFGGSLGGRLVVSGGLGGTGGGQPLAATLLGGAFLGVEADPERLKRRVRNGYCEVMVHHLDEALRILKNAVRKRAPTSVGLTSNCADIIPELASRGVVPDLLTDQTPLHDPLRYVPQGLTLEDAAELRDRDAGAYRQRALASIAAHLRGMLDLQELGAIVLDSGNGLRRAALEQEAQRARDIHESAAEYLDPALAAGRRPLLWVALSGEPADIAAADRTALELFPEEEPVRRWLTLAARHVRFQGLPSRTCWLGREQRVGLGKALNAMVARGEVRAPMVLASGGSGSATTGAALGKAGTRDALLEAAGGAAWLAIPTDTGEPSIPEAVRVVVADGSADVDHRIERLLATTELPGAAWPADMGDMGTGTTARRIKRLMA